MLKRKIESQLENYFGNPSNRMLIIDGARQIGKSYIIRYVGTRTFKNFIEVNMEEDRLGSRLFAEARTVEDFILALGAIAGDKMHDASDTLVFIDEIQAYDHLLTLTKFLMADGRFRYVASGSLLGITLQKTQSIPVGSLDIIHMYPMDFEEFAMANGVGSAVLDEMHKKFLLRESLPDNLNQRMLDLFRKYLLVGGMPDAVNAYLSTHNIVAVRNVQKDIHSLYLADAAKYEADYSRKLKIQRIYKMIPAYMSQSRKRIVYKEIEGIDGKRHSDYQEEFEYLVASGIALEVDAISRPSYPLAQNAGKNLLKLYLNDVGILTFLLYGNNIKPILSDEASVDLGAVYESVVAQELKAHGADLFYYDNKKIGEVDFLIDDSATLSVIPLEVKSGKDYAVHHALDRFLSVKDYGVAQGMVMSNNPQLRTTPGGITYTPIFNVMWMPPKPYADDSELMF